MTDNLMNLVTELKSQSDGGAPYRELMAAVADYTHWAEPPNQSARAFVSGLPRVFALLRGPTIGEDNAGV